jgi:hypothetical protein
VSTRRRPCSTRRAHARRLQVGNVEFVHADERLEAVTGPFDLVHTYIVLQHMSAAAATMAIRRLVAVTAPAGVGALHVNLGYDNESALRRWWRDTRAR